MQQVDHLMLDACAVDIMEQLKPSLKFRALVMKKRVLRGNVVDNIFDGHDKEESAYQFVKELRKQTSSAVTLFIEALEESGQGDLADTLKENRVTAIGELRRGVKSALAKGSDNVKEAGRVPVFKDYLEKCREFASGNTDVVPGEFEFKPEKGGTTRCISKECAADLVRILGGHVEVTVARRHNGLVLARQSDGEAVMLDYNIVIKRGGEDILKGLWTRPSTVIELTVKFYVKDDYQKVTDTDGKDVNVQAKFRDWWPTAPVGLSGVKELQVWMMPAAGAHHIKPVKHCTDIKPVTS